MRWLMTSYTQPNIIIKYSQLSCKQAPLVQDRLVAFGRWSLTEKIKNKPNVGLIHQLQKDITLIMS